LQGRTQKEKRGAYREEREHVVVPRKGALALPVRAEGGLRPDTKGRGIRRISRAVKEKAAVEVLKNPYD